MKNKKAILTKKVFLKITIVLIWISVSATYWPKNTVFPRSISHPFFQPKLLEKGMGNWVRKDGNLFFFFNLVDFVKCDEFKSYYFQKLSSYRGYRLFLSIILRAYRKFVFFCEFTKKEKFFSNFLFIKMINPVPIIIYRKFYPLKPFLRL